MKLLYSSKEIHERIAALGAQITADYAGRTPILVGALKGCTIFMAHLMMHLKIDLEIDFLAVSSYQGTNSGELTLKKDLDVDVAGRDVIIIEDIVDSGKTLKFLHEHLLAKQPASLKIAAFVSRELPRQVPCPPADYICFHCPHPEFLVGFGFDLDEKHRNLPEVYLVDDEQ